MTRLRINRFYKAAALLVICAASAIMGGALRSDGIAPARGNWFQKSDEKIIDRKENPNEPFEFSSLSVKRQKVEPRKTFNARLIAETGGGNVEDWLESLEFTIKNNREKTITYIDLDLKFPETGVGRPFLVYDLDMGVHPSAFGDARQYGKPLALKSGDSITFTLTPRKLEMMKAFLASGGFRLSELNKVIIRVDYLIFEDGTKWEQGSWYKPVSGEEPTPGRPGKYEHVKP